MPKLPQGRDLLHDPPLDSLPRLKAPFADIFSSTLSCQFRNSLQLPRKCRYSILTAQAFRQLQARYGVSAQCQGLLLWLGAATDQGGTYPNINA